MYNFKLKFGTGRLAASAKVSVKRSVMWNKKENREDLIENSSEKGGWCMANKMKTKR